MDCRNIDAIRVENERLLAEAKAKGRISYDELRSLALSLAEALERIESRDFLMADLKSVTTPERVAAAALASPTLLKLKGGA